MASRASVERHRRFVRHERFSLRDVFDESFIESPRFCFQHADRHGNPGSFQSRDALSGNNRIRIDHRADDAPDALLDETLGTRRRLAVMRAWLQRHIERRAFRTDFAILNRFDFRMRRAEFFVPALSDDASVFDEHGTDHRIRPRESPPARRQLQRARHIPDIFIGKQKTTSRESSTLQGAVQYKRDSSSIQTFGKFPIHCRLRIHTGSTLREKRSRAQNFFITAGQDFHLALKRFPILVSDII